MQLANFQQRLELIKQVKPQMKSQKISERAEVIGMFLEKLNADRGKYPPLKAARVAMLLSGIKSVKDLRAFYGECLDRPNFSKFFWWSTNPNKHNN